MNRRELLGAAIAAPLGAALPSPTAASRFGLAPLKAEGAAVAYDFPHRFYSPAASRTMAWAEPDGAAWGQILRSARP